MSFPFMSRGLFGRPLSRSEERAVLGRQQKQRKPARRGRRMLFDSLEPRLLLNADLISIDLTRLADPNADRDVLVRFHEETLATDEASVIVQRVQILDLSDQSVLAFGDYSEFSALTLRSGGGDDRFTIDLASFGEHAAPGIAIDGGEGSDLIVMHTGVDTDWTIDGHNSGLASGPVDLTFNNIENLTGGVDNRDTFTITAAGMLDGLADGSTGGFDTLILQGGFQSAVYRPTGPDSGTFVLDGVTAAFAGLEPTVLSASGGVVTVDLSGLGSSNAILRQTDVTDGAYAAQDFVVENNGGTAFEKIYFNRASSIVVNLTAGADLFTINGLAKATTFALTVNGGAGLDAITIAGDISNVAGAVSLAAETITLAANTDIVTTGNVLLSATAGQSLTSGASASAVADIQIATTASISGRNVSILASATASLTLATSATNIVSVAGTTTATANISVRGAVTATEHLVIAAVATNDLALTLGTSSSAWTFNGDGLEDVGAHALTTATIDIGAVNISGATIDIGSKSDVEVGVNLVELSLAGLTFGSENIAIVTDVTNVTTVTLGAGAKLIQTGSAYVPGAAVSVLVNALDETNVSVQATGEQDLKLPFIPALASASLLFDAVEANTTLLRTTAVKFGDVSGTPALPSVTALLNANIDADGFVKLAAASSGAVDASILTDFTGVVTTAATDTTRVDVAGISFVVGGIAFEASAGSDYSSIGQQASNTLAGSTAVNLTHTQGTAGVGGIELLAYDNSSTLAGALPTNLDPATLNTVVDNNSTLIPKLEVSYGYAVNQIDRDVAAKLIGSALTVTDGGDILVSAERAMTIGAFAEAMTAINATGLINFFDTYNLAAAGTFVLNTIVGDVLATVATTNLSADDGDALTIKANENSLVDAEAKTRVATVGSNAIALGGSVALNTVGWKVSAGSIDAVLLQVAAATLDTVAGTDNWLTEDAVKVEASFVQGAMTTAGAAALLATTGTKLNATVSNTSRSAASKAVNAVGAAVGAIMSGTRISQHTDAKLDNTGYDNVLAFHGGLDVIASDEAQITSNARLVVSSSTTSSGGLGLIDNIVERFIASDFSTSPATGQTEKRVDIAFGNKVQLNNTYGNPVNYTSSDEISQLTIAPGETVKVGELNETPGISIGQVYRYIGSGPYQTILDTEDFTNQEKWALIGGTPGSVYTYLGTATASFNLAAVDYTNKDFWQEVPETQYVPQGLNIKEAPSVGVAGMFVLNQIESGATAQIVNAKVISGGDLNVIATESAIVTAHVDSTASSSGGSSITGTGLSASVSLFAATNVILADAVALVSGSNISTTDADGTLPSADRDVTISASNTSEIEAQNRSYLQTRGTGFNLVVAYNSIGWAFQNVAYNLTDTFAGQVLGNKDPSLTQASIVGSHVAATGDLSLTATSSATITADISNDSTSAPQAFMSAGGLSVSGVLSGNRVAADVSVNVDNTGMANGVSVTAGGTLTIRAQDSSTIHASTELASEVSPKNDLGAGIINGFAQLQLDQYQFTTKSGTQSLVFGDKVYIASDFADADMRGKVYEFMGVTANNVALGTTDYTDRALWRPLSVTTLISESVVRGAKGAIGAVLGKGLSGSALAVYGIVDRNTIDASVSATIVEATIAAAGLLTVQALAAANVRASDESRVRSWGSYGGIIAINDIRATSEASIMTSHVTTTGGADLLVSATNDVSIEAVAYTSTVSEEGSLATAGSAVIALNVGGWKSVDLGSQLVDALIGSDYLTDEQPNSALAFIRNSTVDVAGDVTVEAATTGDITATTGNESSATVKKDLVFGPFGGSSTSAGGILASNKLSQNTQAYIDKVGAGTSVTNAGGTVQVTSQDSANIKSTITIAQLASSTNDLSGIAAIVDQIFPNDYQFTTMSGVQNAYDGNKIRLADTYAGGGQTGGIYEYKGQSNANSADASRDEDLPVSVNLGAINYATSADWTFIPDGATKQSEYFPNIGNVTASNAAAVGLVVGLNDIRGGTSARIQNAKVTADDGDIIVEAASDATILTFLLSNVAASGGSLYGTGTVLALGAQIASNIIIGNVEAFVDNSVLEARDADALDDIETGNVVLSALNASSVDATIHSAVSSGKTAVGVVLAFNTIGWNATNIFTKTADAILGDPLASQAEDNAFDGPAISSTKAYILNSSIDADGDLTLSASGDALINATVSNAAETTAAALFNANGGSGGAILASNRINSLATAYIDNSSVGVTAGVVDRDVIVVGDVAVSAKDSARVNANAKMVASTITTNDGGAGLIQELINDSVGADWRTTPETGAIAKKYRAGIRRYGTIGGRLHKRGLRYRTAFPCDHQDRRCH